jgi:two-component system cell cycle sensor histidine kinase/response regulator CckA
MSKHRILVIDDEEQVALLWEEVLKPFGYDVTSQTNSVEALKAFFAKPDKFDLVISDVTMPNITGDELAKKVLLIRPEIPIILCTGFSERLTEEKAKEMGVREFLIKPIMIHDFVNTVREVLDQSSADCSLRPQQLTSQRGLRNADKTGFPLRDT